MYEVLLINKSDMAVGALLHDTSKRSLLPCVDASLMHLNSDVQSVNIYPEKIDFNQKYYNGVKTLCRWRWRSGYFTEAVFLIVF